MAETIKPEIEAVKDRVETFRQELLKRSPQLEPDAGHSLKELMIHAGYSNIRLANVRDPLTLAELLDDLLLAIGE